ncbi:MAG TPA: hypothetical protein PLJ12_11780 [Planctomycetota bacterium]|nr:hypothetical protein [Planctomycetota bacterium]
MLATLIPLALLAPQATDPSTFHPTDALVYFEMADVQGVLRAYQDSAYARVLEDEACRKALEVALRLKEGELKEPGHYLHQTLGMLTDGLWTQAQPAMADLVAVSASFSLDGITGAQLLDPIKESGRWGEDLVPALKRHTRTLVVVDFRTTESATLAFGMLESALGMGLGEEEAKPQAATLAEHEVQILHVQLPEMDGYPIGVVLDGNRIYGVGGEAPETYLPARWNAQGAQTSAQRFAEGHKMFKSPSGITVFEFQSKLGEAFFGSCPEKEYIQPAIDLLVSGLGPDFDMLLRGGQWRVQLRYADAGSIFVTEAYQKDLNLGEYDRLFTRFPIQAESLDYVHEDSVLASAMAIDTEMLGRFLRHIFKEAGEDPFEEWETQYGFRPETDILANLGATWVSSLPLSSIGLAALPGLSFWIDLKDKQGFIKGMDKLMAVIAGEAGDEYELKSRPYRDHLYYTLRSKTVDGGIEALVQPTVVVFDDRVLFTVSSAQAKKEIKRALLPAMERTPHATFNQQAKPPGDIVEFAYSDWAKVMARLYTSARGFLPMLQSQIPDEAADQIPIDLNHLPDADLFTPFFQPTIRNRERVGNAIRIYCESSLAPSCRGLRWAACSCPACSWERPLPWTQNRSSPSSRRWNRSLRNPTRIEATSGPTHQEFGPRSMPAGAAPERLTYKACPQRMSLE